MRRAADRPAVRDFRQVLAIQEHEEAIDSSIVRSIHPAFLELLVRKVAVFEDLIEREELKQRSTLQVSRVERLTALDEAVNQDDVVLSHLLSSGALRQGFGQCASSICLRGRCLVQSPLRRTKSQDGLSAAAQSGSTISFGRVRPQLDAGQRWGVWTKRGRVHTCRWVYPEYQPPQ